MEDGEKGDGERAAKVVIVQESRNPGTWKFKTGIRRERRVMASVGQPMPVFA
jgi:hypothetical protein